MNIRTALINLTSNHEPSLPLSAAPKVIAAAAFGVEHSTESILQRLIGCKGPILWTSQAVYELVRRLDDERALKTWADEVRKTPHDQAMSTSISTPPAPDRCPTCGSTSPSFNFVSATVPNAKCPDAWHTSDAATQPDNWNNTSWHLKEPATQPAPEPWRPKFKVGDKVKWNCPDTLWTIVDIPRQRVGYYGIVNEADTRPNRQTYRVMEPEIKLPALWTMPTPPAGHEWHRNDFTEEMLPPGTRPLCKGEHLLPGDEYRLSEHAAWTPKGEYESDFPAENYFSHFCRTKRPLPAPSPAQAEPTAKTAGEAAFNHFHHQPGVSWFDGSQERRNRWEEVAQAAIAFAQSSHTEPKPFPTPQDVMSAASKKHSRTEQAKRNVEWPEVDKLAAAYQKETGKAPIWSGISVVRAECLRACPTAQHVEQASGEPPSVEGLSKIYFDIHGSVDQRAISAVREACMRADNIALQKLNEYREGWKHRAIAAEQTIADLRRENEELQRKIESLANEKDGFAKGSDFALKKLTEESERAKRLESDLTAAREGLTQSAQSAQLQMERAIQAEKERDEARESVRKVEEERNTTWAMCEDLKQQLASLKAKGAVT